MGGVRALVAQERLQGVIEFRAEMDSELVGKTLGPSRPWGEKSRWIWMSERADLDKR